MNKQGKIKLFFFLLLMAAVVAGFVIAAPGGKPGAKSKPECRDKIDNDGDGAIDWPADVGCTSKNDKDESNCGDGVCEGSETSLTCLADCGVADSCSDTDGGFNIFFQGTVSGSTAGIPFSNTDSCATSVILTEHRCSGTAPVSSSENCLTNSTSSCINGACV